MTEKRVVPAPHTRVGIGICSYNAPKDIARWRKQLAGPMTAQAQAAGIELKWLVSLADDAPPAALTPQTIWGRNLGVAWTKNRALAALEAQGCDHFFLVEEDARVKSFRWFREVISFCSRAGVHHLMHGPIREWPGTWEVLPDVAGHLEQLVAYRRVHDPQCTPGVVSYISAAALGRCGGLDARFIGRGYGHIEWSLRIVAEMHPKDWLKDSPMWLLDIPEAAEWSFPRPAGVSRGMAAVGQIAANKELLNGTNKTLPASAVPNLDYRHAELPRQLSVCVTLKNRAKQFDKLLASLVRLNAWERVPLEVIVADFGSDDCDPGEVLVEHGLAGRVVPLTGPFSRARGLHAATQAARGDLFVFLDADCLVDPAFGERVRLHALPGAAYFPICYRLNKGAPAVFNGQGGGKNGRCCTSGYGLAAICRQDYETIGGWDRRFARWGGEDDDFAWHVRHRGLRFVRHVCPELFHQWHPNDMAFKEQHCDLKQPSLAGQWRPPKERGVASPTTGNTIDITPGDIDRSMSRWKFHLDTVRQFVANRDVLARKTAYYAAVKRYKERGGPLWADCADATGAVNTKAIVQRVERFRRLFCDIKDNGYDPARSDGKKPFRVKVGPRGGLDVFDGHHRGAVIVVLGITNAVAEVHQRHPAWAAFVDAAWQMYGDTKLYTTIDHPEFSRWKVWRDAESRAHAVADFIGTVPGESPDRVLDFGCCHGGLSLALASMGLHVTAAEQNSKYLAVARQHQQLLAPGGDNEVSWRKGNAWAALEAGGADWCVCASVLHHVVKKKGGPGVARVLKRMARLVNKGLFIELGYGSESQMSGCDMPSKQSKLKPWLDALVPGMTWTPVLKGAPKEVARSGSDRRWLFAWRR